MKKWGFFLSLIIFIIVNTELMSQNSVEILETDLNYTETTEIDITKKEIYQGNLLLANHDYPAREESIKSDIVTLMANDELTIGYGLLNSNINLSTEVAQAFSKMVTSAENEGVNHFLISSGFRNFQEQNKLYQEMGANYALPAGYSEHNLGLSLDVGSTLMEMSKAPEGKWIEKNSWRYGFILRYPEDKIDVTKIQYEPWHIRYVGLPHSAIMYEKNFALEEYIAYLREEKNLSVIIDNKTYTLSYYPISESTSIKIPNNQQYDISGNNVDGVIITISE
ncbi:M15 family metallopeptidase [Bacillus spongiae]|uniref:M15 family metallopeptidase n=1 Tax=Bacillus spongiae TaxID=2683610 RepID=A0ABU8HFY9_9BACI